MKLTAEDRAVLDGEGKPKRVKQGTPDPNKPAASREEAIRKGFLRYIDENRKCHCRNTIRYTANKQCVVCSRARAKKRREKLKGVDA